MRYLAGFTYSFSDPRGSDSGGALVTTSIGFTADSDEKAIQELKLRLREFENARVHSFVAVKHEVRLEETEFRVERWP